MWVPPGGYYRLPLDPSLGFWFSADKLLGMNSTLPGDGTAVSFCADLSGNLNYISQATGASQPTFKTNIINGLPVLRFTGTQWIACQGTGGGNGGISPLFSTMSAITIFTVAQTTTTAGSVIVYLSTGAATGAPRASTNQSTVYAITGRTFDGNGTATASGGTAGINTFTYNTSNRDYVNKTSDIWVGGVNQVSATNVGSAGPGSSTNSKALHIGGAGLSGSMQGDIAEVLIYTGILSTTNRQAVETYLKNKYAL